MSKISRIFIILVLSLMLLSGAWWLLQQRGQDRLARLDEADVYQELLRIFNQPERREAWAQNMASELCAPKQNPFRCMWPSISQCEDKAKGPVDRCFKAMGHEVVKEQVEIIMKVEQLKSCLSRQLQDLALDENTERFQSCLKK